MKTGARSILFAAAAVAACSMLASAPSLAQGVKIGVLNDQSGTFADFDGKGSVEAAKMAIEDFGGSVLGQKIELEGSVFLREKKIQGCSMGSNRFKVDMPRYIDLYLQGRLRLDEMITRRMKLDEVNEAFRAMKAGEVARSVLMFQ